MISQEYCEIFKNTFSCRTPPVAVSDICILLLVTMTVILSTVSSLVNSNNENGKNYERSGENLTHELNSRRKVVEMLNNRKI